MSKKFLIIDDTQDDLEGMKKHFNQAGYDEIFVAETGEEGVELAGKNKPDIAVIDTLLPGIDGFETCKRIKAIGGLDTKVIMITGQVDAFDANSANEAGADDYVVKNSKYVDLIDAVKQLIGTE